MKKYKQSNKGITLIALVITIIVLLILAAVSIVTLTGENGILTQAEKAKTETNHANLEEQVKLAFLGSYGKDGKLNYSELTKNLQNIEGMAGVPDSITEGSFPLTVTVNGEDIKILEDGTIFNSGEWDKTASDEDCFYWASDNPSDEGYGTIIGYTAKIENYTKLRYPSRCTEITFSPYLSNEVGIDSFRSRAFTNNILKVEIPGTVTSIGQSAFGHAYNNPSFRKLEEITIPSSVTSIAQEAFYGCASLSSIIIPDSVTHIGGNAFYNTAWYNNQSDGLLYVGKVAYKYKGTMPNNTMITIKEGTKEISDYAFETCIGLTNITIPNSVTNIGMLAFRGCTNLSSITIPNSVINMGISAFTGWTSSQTINIQGTFRVEYWMGRWLFSYYKMGAIK